MIKIKLSNAKNTLYVVVSPYSLLEDAPRRYLKDRMTKPLSFDVLHETFQWFCVGLRYQVFERLLDVPVWKKWQGHQLPDVVIHRFSLLVCCCQPELLHMAPNRLIPMEDTALNWLAVSHAPKCSPCRYIEK